MTNIQYEIEKASIEDNRLNEVPLKVVIKNPSTQRIKILKIVPNISDNIELEEKADTFETDNKKKIENLCQELSLIISNSLIIRSAEYKKNIIESATQMFSEMSAQLPRLYKLMLINRRLFQSEMSRMNKYFSRLSFRIESLDDANHAYEKWIILLDDTDLEKQMYQAKLYQLENLVKVIGEINSNYIAIVEPGSFYSRTYVLKFTRRKLSTKIYNVSFDSTYSDENSQQEFRANVSTAITISPRQIFLMIFTVCASILGTVLKFCISAIDKLPNPEVFFTNLGNHLVTAPGISSLIISILFFNIYDYTDLGKKLNTGVNWRTALTVGIISGIFGERLIEAIKVFLGLN